MGPGIKNRDTVLVESGGLIVFSPGSPLSIGSKTNSPPKSPARYKRDRTRELTSCLSPSLTRDESTHGTRDTYSPPGDLSRHRRVVFVDESLKALE